MKDYLINIFYSEEDKGYIADIPDLAHCSAFGDTPEAALAEVLQAKADWLEAAAAEGKPTPKPTCRPINKAHKLPPVYHGKFLLTNEWIDRAKREGRE